MTYYCMNAKGFKKEDQTWHAAPQSSFDPEDAATWFMRDHDDSWGEFGRNNTDEDVRCVAVYDSNAGNTTIVAVFPNPMPAYTTDEVDGEYMEYELDIDPESIRDPKPEELEDA